MSAVGMSVNDGESCEENGYRETAGDFIEALSTAVVCKAKVDCKTKCHTCAGETLPILECKCTLTTVKDSIDLDKSIAPVKGVFDASPSHRMCTCAGG